ncbi:MAG: dihydropteroate synthase [Gemmatimonadota bacterium]
MIVSPLSGRSSAIRDALLSHGWEGDVARLTAAGLDGSAYHVTSLSSDTIEAMLMVASRLGLELITGDDWIVLAGARSRLGAFARPWVQPEPVRALAEAIGMAMPGEPLAGWKHAQGVQALGHPVIIGIINVSPDSFSGGGAPVGVEAALGAAELMLAGGATLIDLGGESTSPGARPIAPEEELSRVLPVLLALRQRYPDLPISIDTVHASTAEATLDAGAAIINDVTAGRHDPALLSLVAERGAGVVLSHSRGALGALASYDLADYGGSVTDGVTRELAAAITAARDAGIAHEAIVIDPGFGFAKTPEQNFQLLSELDALVALGAPVLVGPSRKRFLGEATGRPIDDRERATAAVCALACDRGARLFRLHDPAASRDALAIATALHPGPP